MPAHIWDLDLLAVEADQGLMGDDGGIQHLSLGNQPWICTRQEKTSIGFSVAGNALPIIGDICKGCGLAMMLR